MIDRQNKSVNHFLSGDLMHSLRLLYRFRQHVFQDDLERHTVAAPAATLEKVTITLPDAILHPHRVRIILTIEGHVERFEANAITFLGITLGFVDLPDHARVHWFCSPFEIFVER
jgi:hypothetical protein